MISAIHRLYLDGKITNAECEMLIELHYYLQWKRKPFWKRALITVWRVVWD